MFPKALASIAFLFAAYGPATAAPQLNDVRVNALAVADVLTAKCQTIQPNVSTYVEYRKAASKLLSVADLNSNLYSESYQKVTRIVSAKTTSQMRGDCDEFIPKIAAMIPEMHTDYEAYIDLADAAAKSEARAWAEAVEMFATAAAQLRAPSQSFNYPFIPIPSARISIGSNSSSGGGYRHYLVNTPGGTRQCRASSSGYIFCN